MPALLLPLIAPAVQGKVCVRTLAPKTLTVKIGLMMGLFQRSYCNAFLAGLLMATVGCATGGQRADLPLLKPAAVDVGGMRRMAFLGIPGDDATSEAARNAVVAALQDNGYYDLVHPRDLQRFARGPLYDHRGRPNMNEAVNAARRMGIDLLLAGELRFKQEGAFGAQYPAFGDSTLSAGVEFELVAVRSGQILMKERVISQYTGEFSNHAYASNYRPKVLARLSREAALKVVPKIAPHQATAEVQLAAVGFSVGAAETRKGNRLAAEGKWEDAIRSWEEAVDNNRANHAAMYNLGVGYEAVGEFEQAAKMYRTAVRMSNSPMYQAAIERVEQAGHEHYLATMQLEQRPNWFGPQTPNTQHSQFANFGSPPPTGWSPMLPPSPRHPNATFVGHPGPNGGQMNQWSPGATAPPTSTNQQGWQHPSAGAPFLQPGRGPQNSPPANTAPFAPNRTAAGTGAGNWQ